MFHAKNNLHSFVFNASPICAFVATKSLELNSNCHSPNNYKHNLELHP